MSADTKNIRVTRTSTIERVESIDLNITRQKGDYKAHGRIAEELVKASIVAGQPINWQIVSTLNDKPGNLREATHMQNMWNMRRRREQALPTGVRLIPKSGRFQARIRCNNKMHHLGAYDTPGEAHAIYLKKRKEMFGEFA